MTQRDWLLMVVLAQSKGDENRQLFVTSQERKRGNFELKNMS